MKKLLVNIKNDILVIGKGIMVGVNWYFKICEYIVQGIDMGFKMGFRYIDNYVRLILKVLYNLTLRYVVLFIIFISKYPPLKWIVRLFKSNKKISMNQKKALTGYAFISPFIVGFFALALYPFGRVVYMSFNNVIQFQQDYTYDWVGLENFRRILRVDIDFVLEMQNFLVRVLLYTPVIITLAIIIAMLLNQKIKGKGFFRMIFFLPIIILNGELLANMSDYGGMDITLSFFVLDVITTIVPAFAVDLFVELFGIIIEILWYTGVPILIFLAMLQKVDKSLYEAASIDGANAWSIFWKITLPIISPAISVSIIFIVVFLGNFDANPINTLITESSIRGDRLEGYASAMALIYSFIQVFVIGFLLFVSSGSARDVLFRRNRQKKLIPKSQRILMNKKGAKK